MAEDPPNMPPPPVPVPAAQRQIKKRKTLKYAEKLEVVKQIDSGISKQAVALTYGINESTIRAQDEGSYCQANGTSPNQSISPSPQEF
ncbi:putative CENP-B N-terminal DNA-binding domain-containing protein 3 [Homarus americanus]|uniref:Putative CENP-B N-terminal DNA-binding domain-containing protein 3 n=1 Tax=Homarus americanus TaxID=6706 RepID=A0A8J5JLA0_HOMAM|nr:putative CENP-B N-terminal DNA-binding domain-containing protein 3 [Homarus americanus]